MTEPDIVINLRNAGYESGWAISDGILVLWEHDEEPPAPYLRPAPIAPDETPE